MTLDSTAQVHPAAIVAEGATVAAGCRIGPYCVIGAEVELEAGVILHSHVVVGGVMTWICHALRRTIVQNEATLGRLNEANRVLLGLRLHERVF